MKEVDNVDEFISQWAILPARVRYDKNLTPNAKLVYSEIAAKCNKYGYCFSYNKHFAECFGLKEDTVSNLVKTLEDAGYIRIDVDKRRPNGQRRKIWLTAKPYEFGEDESQGIGFKSDTLGTGQKSDTVPDLNPGPIENNNLKYNTPYSPPEGAGERDEDNGDGNEESPRPEAPHPADPPDKGAKGQAEAGEGGKPRRRRRTAKDRPDWKPERFEGFYEFYPLHKARADAVRAWDALKPDDALIERMGRALIAQKRSEAWQRGIGIPYPASWLNGRRWTDEVDAASLPPPQAEAAAQEERPWL